MAILNFTSSSAQTRKHWSELLLIEILNRSAVMQFIGDGPDAIVQRVNDLTKMRGDEVKIDLRLQKRNAGVWGTNRLTGNELEVGYSQQDVRIDLWRDGRSWDIMSQQRSVHALERDARADLAQQIADTMDALWHGYINGVTFDPMFTGETLLTATAGFAGNFLLAPNLDNVLNNTTEQLYGGTIAAGSNSKMTLGILKQAKARAKTLDTRVDASGNTNFLIRPGRLGGKTGYVALLNPRQVLSLKNDTSSTSWTLVTASAAQRNEFTNPVFDGGGAIEFKGFYDGIMIFESTRQPYDSTNDHAYAVLLGAQSSFIAGGNALGALGVKTDSSMRDIVPFGWTRTVDDDINIALHAMAILGIQKAFQSSKNFAVIDIITTGDDVP